MNNILDWIKALPLEQEIIDKIIIETINDKGHDYIMNEQSEVTLKNFGFAILFVWNKTPQGFEYWADINQKIPYKNGY
jgi:hypothetical protein